ncbi:MAG: TolC family protein [Bacteroidota bacterium]
MKKIIILYCLTIMGFSAFCQEVTLKECLESAMANDLDLQIKQLEVNKSKGMVKQANGKFLPTVTMDFESRYNAVIPTQVIPAANEGEEDVLLTFGTNWQQNIGINLRQSLLDLSLRSKINEARLQRNESEMNFQIEENELKMEVFAAFIKIYEYTNQLRRLKQDTVRSHISLMVIKERYSEGKTSRIELNRAVLDHRLIQVDYSDSLIKLQQEVSYLAFLTGIEFERILKDGFDFRVFERFNIFQPSFTKALDSIAMFKLNAVRQSLVQQQIRTERSSRLPKIELAGFYGANQFSDDFNPIRTDDWFGNSFIGLNVSFPLFGALATRRKVNELEYELEILVHQKDQELSRMNREIAQAKIGLANTMTALSYLEESIVLLNESVSLSRQQLKEGKISAQDLSLITADLRKSELAKSIKRSELIAFHLQLIDNSGALDDFLNLIM